MPAVKKSKSTDKTSDRELIITRTFDAPRELVWSAWTDPQQVVKWWGPNGFTTTIEKMDFKVGGTWKHVMRGPDGVDYPNKSVFTEIVTRERISYTHGGGKKDDAASGISFEATWTFEALDPNKTKLTIHQLFPTAEMRDKVVKIYNAVEGANQTLGRLGEFLITAPVILERTFAATAATVWQALTDLDHMKKWYFPTIESFNPVVGFQTRVPVRHNDIDYPHLWKVTEVVPGKKITYSWKYENHHGESFVTFELFPAGHNTRLKLTHEKIETFEGDKNPVYARKNFIMGWTEIIGTSLKAYVEKSAPSKNVGRKYVFTRTVDAPRKVVFKAWTDPKQVAKWWGPKGFTNPVCEINAHPGGAILIHMRGPDGNIYPMTGVFQEIKPPERIVFTAVAVDDKGAPQLENLNTVTLTEKDGKTKLVLEVQVLKATSMGDQFLQGMEQGWTESLERLADFSKKV